MHPESIDAHLRESLKPFIGQTNDLVTLDTIKSVIKKSLPPCASNVKVDAKTAWAWMGWRERVKWFALTRWPLKSWGNQWRAAIDSHNFLARQLVAYEQDELIDILGTPTEIEYPIFLHPKPKEIVITHTSMQLSEPLNFLSINITV